MWASRSTVLLFAIMLKLVLFYLLSVLYSCLNYMLRYRININLVQKSNDSHFPWKDVKYLAMSPRVPQRRSMTSEVLPLWWGAVDDPVKNSPPILGCRICWRRMIMSVAYMNPFRPLCALCRGGFNGRQLVQWPTRPLGGWALEAPGPRGPWKAKVWLAIAKSWLQLELNIWFI